jgi:hypothetical protein
MPDDTLRILNLVVVKYEGPLGNNNHCVMCSGRNEQVLIVDTSKVHLCKIV